MVIDALSLIEFWKGKLDVDHTSHPADRDLLTSYCSTFKPDNDPVMSYIEESNSAPFELTLLPHPYNGDLRRAKVFILMLNPGLSLTDYHIASEKKFIQESLNVINQEGFNPNFPFSCLNPEFYYWSGFQYWHAKLRPLILEIKKMRNSLSYKDALSFISQNTAVVQYVAYHSRGFGSKQSKLGSQLKSTEMMQDFVHTLVERANRHEIVLLVGRASQRWKSLQGLSSAKDLPILVNNDRAFLLKNKHYDAVSVISNFLMSNSLSPV
jgi:hypothetical protein